MLFQGNDDAVDPLRNALPRVFLQLLLPLLVGKTRLTYGLRELTIAEHGTTRQVQTAVKFHHYIDFVGTTHGLEEYRLVGVVVGIGRIDIGHESHLAVGALHIAPAHEILVGLTNEVKRDILERSSYVLHLVVLLVGSFLASQFFLADSQQELQLLADALCSVGYLLSHHVLFLEQVCRVVQQFDSLFPESGVWLYIALHYRVWGTCTTTLSTHGLLGIKDGIVLQLSP